MNFDQWLAVLVIITPLIASLGVTLMLRRDVDSLLRVIEKHETRLDRVEDVLKTAQLV